MLVSLFRRWIEFLRSYVSFIIQKRDRVFSSYPSFFYLSYFTFFRYICCFFCLYFLSCSLLFSLSFKKIATVLYFLFALLLTLLLLMSLSLLMSLHHCNIICFAFQQVFVEEIKGEKRLASFQTGLPKCLNF